MSINYADAARLIRKGRRAEQRGAALKGCIGSLIESALLSLLKGWLFMLAVGLMHSPLGARLAHDRLLVGVCRDGRDAVARWRFEHQGQVVSALITAEGLVRLDAALA